jgi:tRNA(Ile)-lysidine synthetase-like protein
MFNVLISYINAIINLINELYNNYAIEKYDNVLEYVPQEQIKISNQHFDLTNNLITTLDSFCKENIDNNSKKVIVSLSGGVDSMVLTTILKLLGYNVICGHINYSNRNETYEEQEFLEKWCYYNSIKLYVNTINSIKRYESKRNEYEAITKKIRFDFYKEIMLNEGLSMILLGHHKDDVLENIFANICRGRNILDLAVIKESCTLDNVHIMRPMLGFYKNSIYDFAKCYQVPYFKDSTPHWSIRGKYRNKIYPQLEDAFPSLKSNLLELSNQSTMWNTLVQDQLIEPFLKTVSSGENKCVFNIEKYKDYPHCFWNIILMKLFYNYGHNCPSKKAVQVFIQAINYKNNGFISLTHNCVCKSNNYELTIEFLKNNKNISND